MFVLIKKNTIPEEVGNYDNSTKILEINKNLKMYTDYSFTKEVKAIVPAKSDLTISFVGKIQLNHDLGTKDKQWSGVTY